MVTMIRKKRDSSPLSSAPQPMRRVEEDISNGHHVDRTNDMHGEHQDSHEDRRHHTTQPQHLHLDARSASMTSGLSKRSAAQQYYSSSSRQHHSDHASSQSCVGKESLQNGRGHGTSSILHAGPPPLSSSSSIQPTSSASRRKPSSHQSSYYTAILCCICFIAICINAGYSRILQQQYDDEELYLSQSRARFGFAPDSFADEAVQTTGAEMDSLPQRQRPQSQSRSRRVVVLSVRNEDGGGSFRGHAATAEPAYTVKSLDAMLPADEENADVEENEDGGLKDAEESKQLLHAGPNDVAISPVEDNPSLAEPNQVEAKATQHAHPHTRSHSQNRDQCAPLADWQTKSFPNCNAFHELNLVDGLIAQYQARHRHRKHNRKKSTAADQQEHLTFLGQGWFRTAWRYNGTIDFDPSIQDTDGNVVVLKTLRIEREFLEEYYDLHRKDAVAMERLTSSAFVMDVYGYCGQSALNEWANFNPDILSLQQLTRRLRGQKGTLSLRLRLATSVALGLAHVHGVNARQHDTRAQATKDTRVGMVHYDLNPSNIAIVRGAKPKLNDFNTAEFLTYRAGSNKTCGLRSRLHEPWWRAPEEMDLSSSTYVDEKVDVYALGNLLFHIWTTHSPRGKMKRERMDEVRALVRNGVPPTIPADMLHSKKAGDVAFRKAMEMCFCKDPRKRGTAQQVADVLYAALVKMSNKAT